MEDSIWFINVQKWYGFILSSLLFFFVTSFSWASSIQEAHYLRYETAASNKAFIYDPRTFKWTATQNGKVIRTGSGSGGAKYCSDVKRACKTPSGTFKVYSKGGATCRSSRYPLGKGGAPMPHCMFFKKNYAIHGSPDVPKRNASHGCIRVKTKEARWLHKNFIDVGTRVVVKPY